MMESNDSSINNSPVNNTFTLSTLILSILGFFDAAYLTLIHYKNVIPPCSIAHGCEKVLTSKFSTVYGIPIQIFGLVFYLVEIILILFFMQTKQKKVFLFFCLLSLSGLLVSIGLFSLQAFVIHAFCQYCLASEIIILLISVSSCIQLGSMGKNSA